MKRQAKRRGPGLAQGWGLACAACVLLSGACVSDNPGAPTMPALEVQSPEVAEGELLGNLFVSGTKSSTGTLVELIPFDDATWARLRQPFSVSMWGNPSYPWMWEWFDPKGGGNCGDLADYLEENTEARELEAHWSDASTPPPDPSLQVREAHCIRPGKYILSAGAKSVILDYVPLAHVAGSPALITVANATAGLTEFLEAQNWDDTLNGFVDLVVNIDVGSGSYSDTPVLDVENSGQNWRKSTFADQLDPAGTETDYFRFSAALSTSSWPGDAKGRALARLYWDFANDRSSRTGYYYTAHPDQNSYVIRHHRYGEEVTESRPVQVALEFMRPDEPPDDTVGVASRMIYVTRLVPLAPPDVTISGPTYISMPGNYTWNANVSGGVPPYSYQWWYRLLTGGKWQMLTGETNAAYTRYVGYSQWAFRLRADVTDSLGLVGSGNIVVDVAWGARPITDSLVH